MRREGFARITKGFEMRNSWNINGLQHLSNRVSPQFNAERRESVRFHVEPMYSSVLVREIGVLAAPLAGLDPLMVDMEIQKRRKWFTLVSEMLLTA